MPNQLKAPKKASLPPAAHTYGIHPGREVPPAGHGCGNGLCMKTILMIAPNFPPTSAVGGIRSLKFAKYLPGFGWKPIVITLSAQDQKLSDATLLSELPPQVEIHRPGYFNYRKYLRGDIPWSADTVSRIITFIGIRRPCAIFVKTSWA